MYRYAYLYTEYREVLVYPEYIRYLGLKFGDMDRRLRSIQVSDLCVTIRVALGGKGAPEDPPTNLEQEQDPEEGIPPA